MIKTGVGKIPFYWLLVLSIPVASMAFIDKCSGTALAFTMKKIISDPSLIVFLGSINKIFGVFVAPLAAYYSDVYLRRTGRKPFVIIGMLLLAVSLVIVPTADTLWAFIAVLIIYQFSVDFGYTGPWNPLYFDIVPKPQRGRAMVVNRYASVAAHLVFMYFLIGRFDNKIYMNIPKKFFMSEFAMGLSGEQVIYYTGAAAVFISALIVMFLIRENRTEGSGVKIEKGYFGNMLSLVLFDRRNRMLCLLVITSVLMSARLELLRPLLITEQFGYSKQVMGSINVYTMFFNLLLVLPVVMYFIDKVDYFKVYAVCILLSTLHPLVYWLYVRFFAVGGIPSVAVITGFNIADSIFDRTAIIALWPLVFNMCDQRHKGLVNSGFLIVSGVVAFVSANLMGLWVKYYSNLFSNGTCDYMSAYLYVFMVGIVACCGLWYFAKNKPAEEIASDS